MNEIECELLRMDVHSWHVDSATVKADTYLCTYLAAPSEGLRNEEARRRVDVPEMRAELLRLHGGEDDAGFQEHLHENYLDLHYTPLPGRDRIPLAWAACGGPPRSGRAARCRLHPPRPGDDSRAAPPRLLLIS